MAFKKRAYFAVGCIVAVLAFILGVLIGYFSHLASDTKSKDDQYNKFKLLTRQEDESIRNKLFESVDVKHMDEVLRFLTDKPTLAGTERQKETADYVYKEFVEFGLEAEIIPYNVLLSYPTQGHNNTVNLLDSDGTVLHETTPYEEVFSDKLRDPTEVQGYHGFSPSGNVQGDLVYANYGTRSDFEKLKEQGINCTGKIVIARYGKIFRGNKVDFAYQAGAIGIIIYSDPKDYSSKTKNVSAVYPDTWWLPDTGIQRGNIVLWKGDQSTPGYLSTWYSYRISEEELNEKLPKIPSQPIGARDAYALMRELEGTSVEETWQGGFNFTYKTGPGLRHNRKVSMDIRNDNKYRTIYNVCGKITGAIEPDRYVIVGNHRDAWVTGGSDPSSGSMMQQEVARIFGKLVKEGWRPRRSILICSWDAEEFGLVGSNEWVEDNIKWLTGKAVVYINADTSIAGNETINFRSVPLLHKVYIEAAKKVADPRNELVSVYDTWKGKAKKPHINKIRGGSDMVPFIANVGVSTYYAKYAYLKDEWDNTNTPVYHTRYMTHHLIKLIDPQYKFSKALLQIMAETIRDLSDSVIIPFGVDDYISELERSVGDLIKNFEKIGNSKLQSQLDGIQLGLANLSNAADAFKINIENVDTFNPLAVREINDKLMAFDRAFIDINGLPNRPRYKHILHSPSGVDYYGGLDFPGLEDLMYSWSIDPKPETMDKIQKHLATIAYCLYSAAKVLS